MCISKISEKSFTTPEFKKSLTKIDELIKDTILTDSHKNKLYKETKEHNEKTYKKMMMSLKDILGPIEESNQYMETLSPVLESTKDSPRRSPVLISSKSTPRLNKEMTGEDSSSSPLLNFKHSPKKWDVRDDVSSFLLNRSQTPNSALTAKIENSLLHRKSHGRLGSAHSLSHKELKMDNSLNKLSQRPENSLKDLASQDLNKIVSCVKVSGKNFTDAAKRIKDASLKGEKVKDLYIKNLEDCGNVFEKQLNELSEKVGQIKLSSPVISLETVFTKGQNSVLSSPVGCSPFEFLADDLVKKFF